MVKQILTLKDLRGKSLAVDANNYLYQFLALIRKRDGKPLTDSQGNITSHLIGLMFRSTRLMCDFNIDLVFVFDGQPPELKGEEIRNRREKRKKALQEWQQALRSRDYAKAFSKAVMTSRLTHSMIEDAKLVLTLLGIPYVQAPSEAEAQIAYMSMRGDVWAASSKDYDTILFGASKLLRFLTIHGREYLPRKRITKPLKPELIDVDQFLSHHEITRSQLIDIAVLIGTDFNEGIKGVGPKTALRLVKEYQRIENLPCKFLSNISPHYKEVREIYLNPKTTSEYNLSYSPLHEKELTHFLREQRNFAHERVETVVQRMKEVYRMKKQTRLQKWFAKHR